MAESCSRSSMVRDFARRVMEVDGALPASAFSGSALLDEAELEELERFLEGEQGAGAQDSDGDRK